MLYKIEWMGHRQTCEAADKQEQGPKRVSGIWLMVRSTANGPLRRIWFAKSEVTKFDNTTVEA